jgi:hypothetical protein
MDSAVARLGELVDEALPSMSYEEREAIADALWNGDVAHGAMSPRASALARRLDDQLAAIEQAGGAASRRDWTELICRDISEPSHGKLPHEMSEDELHRELERRKKYRSI